MENRRGRNKMDKRKPTKVVKIDPKNPDYNIIKEAALIIKQGGLVIYPTETCYGLAANALDPKAVKRVYEVKGRPYNKPLSIAVSDLEMAKRYAYFTPEAEKLVKELLPGPLTIALPKKPEIPDIVNPDRIAIRIPNNLIAILLIKEAGIPITATSANKTGDPPPYNINDAINSLVGSVDFVIDAGQLPKVQPSTIVDFTEKPYPLITRVGPIPPSKILKILNIPREKWNKHIRQN